MKSSETIRDMYTQFTNVVNSLKVLGKFFSNFKLFNKILRSLSKSGDPKVTAIQEAKDLNNFPLEELIGSLMTYEITCNAHEELENNLSKNMKDLTLRTHENHLRENSSDDDNDDDDFALLTRKFKKFIKRNKTKHDTKNKNELKKDQIICYECKKLGHFKSECPIVKKKQPKKKKVLKTTWDDLCASKDKEQINKEVANYMLMALDDKVSSSFEANLSFDELLNTFYDLFDEYKLVSKKYKLLKKRACLSS
ncbi:unnamed protein product [Musa textilis]